MKKVYFPKKSHHGYYDEVFGRHFYSEKEKRSFMEKNKFVEAPSATKAHQRRVNEFVRWFKDERRKNPNFDPKKESYPT